ncbi:MAG: hypothetical protein RBS22_10995 [Spongiibacteraceae bacterium]|jgi:hypothetical protein|nr:hypothetical protein [Spongiibacteraceae bacterium]
MTDIHIDDFHRDTALILLRLYAQFPRKTTLYVDDICGPDTPDEFGLHSERWMACFSTMIWLAEQGYLRFEQPIRQEAIDQAVLTEASFLLLSSRSDLHLGLPEPETPLPASVIEGNQSNIMQLRQCVKAGSSIMTGQCVRYLLNQIRSFR